MSKNQRHSRLSPDDCREVSRMLGEGVKVPTIVATLSLSKTTVDRIRAALNALTYTVPNEEREDDGFVRDNEWAQAEERRKKVNENFSPAQQQAILQGLVDAKITIQDLIPPESS